MNLNDLKEYIENLKWGLHDYRALKPELLVQAQKKLNEFKPLNKKDYYNNKIQVIDFFCGAGGTTLGFAALNSVVPVFKFLGGCDINKISAETYSLNYDTPLINLDVRELAYDNQLLNELLLKINYNPMLPTILIGCAPCQGFTSHRKKHWAESDDDKRNSLILAFTEIVKKINPDAILIENVPEFLSKKYWNYFSNTKSNLESFGYTVKQAIYNAAEFGVPQERFRAVIMGMKHDFILPSGYLQPNEYKTVRDAIGDLVPVKAGEMCKIDKMHKSISHKPSTVDIIKQVAHNGGNRPVGVGPSCLDKTKGFSDSYGRLYWDRPSITITHYARNPASGRYCHPEQDRGLTAREAALLQSFPFGFDFTGKSDDIYRQIGEAVPPLFSAGLATDILIELISSLPTQKEIDVAVKPIVIPVSSSFSSVIAGIKSNRGR